MLIDPTKNNIAFIQKLFWFFFVLLSQLQRTERGSVNRGAMSEYRGQRFGRSDWLGVYSDRRKGRWIP